MYPMLCTMCRESSWLHLCILAAVLLPTKVKEFFGLLPQEYVCVAREDLPDHPRLFLTTTEGTKCIEVTSRHLLLGYKPLLIGIRLDEASSGLADVQTICLSFTNGEFKPGRQWRGFWTTVHCLARLQLSRMKDDLGLTGLIVFKGEFGEQSFLPVHQALANRVADRIRRKPGSEANLKGNQYDQVRVAYSIPRAISVITVNDGELLNFFPTDLHGQAADDVYVSSLRIGGMACNQVESLTRIVISHVEVKAFRETYALGKNHMKPLRPAQSFGEVRFSSDSGIPVYPNATDYLELDRIAQWDAGIHRLFAYKIVGRGEVRKGKTLAHIHRYYAQWRLNHHKSAEYFYR